MKTLMMRRGHDAGRLREVVVVLCTVLTSSGATRAEGQVHSMRALIEQALDQQVDITVEKQPLAKAFELIGSKTGVKLTIRPEVVDLLPYGSETLASATIKNVSLRQGLAEMLSYLGMTMRVRDHDVAIEPIEPLRRICRRATWSELKQLHELLTTPYSSEAMSKLPFQFQIRTSTDPSKEFLTAAAKVGQGTLAEVLEDACNQLDWTWYPWDNSIVVLTRAEQASRFVDKPITLRYSHASLGDVLADLARQADLRLRLEPGVLKALPVETQQNFSLMMQQATIRTALEMISGATGLAYDVTPTEIVIKHTSASRCLATQPATVIRSDDPIVGTIAVPIGTGKFKLEFFVRESDLPPRVREWRKQQIDQAVKQIEGDIKR
jgi:hypothetical protein